MSLVAFKHSGDLGDLIFALPAVRAHLERKAPGAKAAVLLSRSPETGEPMTPARAALIKPLLLAQPYVGDVRLWCGERAIDLDAFRSSGRTMHFNLADLHLDVLGLPHEERQRPWLTVDRTDRLPGRPVVFARGPRWGNPLFNWRRMEEVYGLHAFFLGLGAEWELLNMTQGVSVPHVPTANLLEAARLIAGAELFVGGQGVLHAIAEGLHKRIVLEVSPRAPTPVFVREGVLNCFETPRELPPIRPSVQVQMVAPPDGQFGQFVLADEEAPLESLTLRPHGTMRNPFESVPWRARVLYGVPTLSRVDLLNKHYTNYRDLLNDGDLFVVLDNGSQAVDLPPGEQLQVHRPGRNLGVPASWNWLLRRAFVHGDYDVCVLLQDDVWWGLQQAVSLEGLLAARPEVDLLLAHHQFSVQVHRRRNWFDIGPFEEGFGQAWREDDDYALRMTRAGRRYERFRELDPGPGSICNGTPKGTLIEDAAEAFKRKWGAEYPTNDPNFVGYDSNKELTW